MGTTSLVWFFKPTHPAVMVTKILPTILFYVDGKKEKNYQNYSNQRGSLKKKNVNKEGEKKTEYNSRRRI